MSRQFVQVSVGAHEGHVTLGPRRGNRGSPNDIIFKNYPPAYSATVTPTHSTPGLKAHYFLLLTLIPSQT